MKSDTRFVFAIYAPPFLAAVYLIAWNLILQNAAVVPLDDKVQAVNPLPILPWFFGAVILLSFLYAIAMEVAFDTRLRPDSWIAVFFSEILGLLAGMAIGRILSGINTLFDQTFTYEIAGAATGLTMGLIIKLLFSKTKITLPVELQV